MKSSQTKTHSSWMHMGNSQIKEQGVTQKHSHTTWGADISLPSLVIASGVKLHISSKGIGIDRETVGNNFPSRRYSKT